MVITTFIWNGWIAKKKYPAQKNLYKDEIRQRQARNGEHDYQYLSVDMDWLKTKTGASRNACTWIRTIKKKKENITISITMFVWNSLIPERCNPERPVQG